MTCQGRRLPDLTGFLCSTIKSNGSLVIYEMVFDLVDFAYGGGVFGLVYKQSLGCRKDHDKATATFMVVKVGCMIRRKNIVFSILVKFDFWIGNNVRSMFRNLQATDQQLAVHLTCSRKQNKTGCTFVREMV